MKRKGRKAGLTVLELAIVMGIGLIILAGATALAVQGYRNFQVARATDELKEIFTLADRAFTSSPGYVDGGGPVSLTRLMAINGELPNVFTPVTGGKFKTPWGSLAGATGEFLFRPESTDGVTMNLGVLEVTGLPLNVCTRLVAAISAGVYDTKVNGRLVPLKPGPTACSASVDDTMQGKSCNAGRNRVQVGSASELCKTRLPATVEFRHLKPVDYRALRNQPLMDTLQAGPESCTDPGCFTATYNRTENAMKAREAAQAALP